MNNLINFVKFLYFIKIVEVYEITAYSRKRSRKLAIYCQILGKRLASAIAARAHGLLVLHAVCHFFPDVIEVRAGGKWGKICYHKGLRFFLVHPLQCCISIRVFIKASMEKFSISLREFFKSTFFLWPTRRFRIQYLDGRSEFDVAAARTTWPHPQMRGRAAPAVLRLS